jgi:hypothetical protein
MFVPAWYGWVGRFHEYIRQCSDFDVRSVPFLYRLTDMIVFQNTQLALLHIPLHLYSNFLQSILQLLLPTAHCGNESDDSDGAVQLPDGWSEEPPFINISVTPVECSIVCSRKVVNELFVPVISTLDATSRNAVHVTTEDFVVMQIDGEGLDADQRVLELTGPLALAGM